MVDKLARGWTPSNSDIVSGKPNRFGQGILKAVYWFGNYQAQSSADYQLLNLATSIGSCFGTQSEDKIITMLTEGLALLHGTTFEERVNLQKEFKKLYSKRSKISHGDAAAGSITTHDIDRYEELARSAIIFLLRHVKKFTSMQDFREHLDNVKLGRNLYELDDKAELG
ncbi:hypothetical protein [Deinococcus navajonensis]|uniref:Apea-like HEPN domain-containing protein n=1 Tax=Deinococcus navajonensis TaxID=309884 RepID=A0ABV8XQP6_9DEIO